MRTRTQYVGNKYRAQKQTYNGRSFDSKLEAGYAAQLDWMIKAGEVESWVPQFKIEGRINGVLCFKYFIDFKVFYTDGHVEYHEVKGFETALWKLKWKVCKALYPEWTFQLIK